MLRVLFIDKRHHIPHHIKRAAELIGLPAAVTDLHHQRLRMVNQITRTAAPRRAAGIHHRLGGSVQLAERAGALLVEIVPVDPRSLMQGDYMRLNFALPTELERDLNGLVTAQRPYVIAQRDANGVARLLRLARPEAPSASLAPGEFRIELTPKNGAWNAA